jgi:hypothetical protein
MKTLKAAGFILVAILAVSIGVYPFLYFLADMSGGLLAGKSAAVLSSQVWSVAFNTHIIF